MKGKHMPLGWILAGLAVLAAAGFYVFAQYMGSRAFRGLDKDLVNVIEKFGKKAP